MRLSSMMAARMSYRRPLALVAIAAAVAAPAAAQTSRGAGVSGGTFPEGVHVAYVRESMGTERQSSERLVAALLWRAATDWAHSRTEDDAARVKALMDSASAAARARGNVAGGSLTPRGAAWVEYDERGRAVLLSGRRLSAPRGDSALVVLVDRADGVGGAPTVTAFALPAAPVTVTTPDADTPEALRDASARHFGALFAAWERFLRADPRVRAFLRGAGRR